MFRLDLIICVGLICMAITAMAISRIAKAYFEAVSRNPTIGSSITTQLLALASMAELAMLIMTAVCLYLMFKL